MLPWLRVQWSGRQFLGLQLPVAATVEEQGRDAGIGFEAFHVAHEDQVVAAGVVEFVADLKAGVAAGQEGGAAQAGGPGNAGELVFLAGGEVVGEGFLLQGKDVHRVVAGALEAFQVGGAGGQAPQDQGRLQGDGAEGIDGQPHQGAVGPLGGDHRNSGGKAAQGIAEGAAVETGGGDGLIRRQYGGGHGGGAKKSAYYPPLSEMLSTYGCNHRGLCPVLFRPSGGLAAPGRAP